MAQSRPFIAFVTVVAVGLLLGISLAVVVDTSRFVVIK
jgi:hypothetical protein